MFSTSEVVYTGMSTNANPTTLAASFVIPAGTATSGNGTGLHRMRIGGRDTGVLTDPCYNGSYGCIEDYSIQVIVPVTPTITSLSASQGCTGSSLTITGTNFLGATVRIGGTVSTVTANTGTSITVIVGTGTTGTLTVTTPGGTATSAATFTVNPLPANPLAPTSDSPQCNPPGVTLTRAGTVPAGITWYWQTTATGTSTANSDPTYLVTTSGTYYLRAQNNSTGCWSTGSGARTVVVNSGAPGLAPSPNPTNGSTGVCYSGANPRTSISWGGAANAVNYDVFFGTTPTPPLVSSAQTARTYNTGTLLANTTYYWRIVPKNACGDTTGAVITWSFTTSDAPCYCIPNNTYSTTYYISGVTTTGGSANINNTPTDFSQYTDYTSQFVSQFATGSFEITATHPSSTYGYNVWIDWNKDGDFNDAGENVISTGYLGTPANIGTITIPPGQAIGDYRMRIRNGYLSNPAPACGAFDYGEAEDYTVRVIVTPPCAAQPTGLNATAITQTSATINWTAATPPPSNGYEYYYSTSSTPPTSGTTPSGTVGGGVISANLTSLTPGTTYYFWVRGRCSGLQQSGWTQGSFMTPIPNDDCGGAIGLTVNSDFSCSIVTAGTNVGATASPQADDVTGTPDNDVWFSFVATGPQHQVSLLNVVAIVGYSTDMGIGVYSSIGGVCSSLSLVGSSDPDTYNIGGLTAGITYFVRIYGWSSGSGSAQTTFDVCIGTPPPPPNNDEPCTAEVLTVNSTCIGTPGHVFSATNSGINACSGTPNNDVWYVFQATDTSQTVSLFNVSGSTTDMYHVVYGPFASGSCNVTVGSNIRCNDDDSSDLTGLVVGSYYFVQVYTWSSSAATTIFEICITLPCEESLVISDLPTLCPTVIIDQQGNDPFLTNPFVLNPNASIDCTIDNVTLVANPNLRETTSYIVEKITYPNPAPNYNFPLLSNGNNQSITTDDYWADSKTNLEFGFCFYENSYNQTLVSPNGAITFDSTINAGDYAGYSFSNNLPSTAGALFEQTIYGVYHDIIPTSLPVGAIKSRTVGAAPCRQFQVSWNDIPMFGDATRLYTGMIVLHETTNIIEVFIKEKRIENGNVSPWNGGNAIVGIQGDISPLSPNNQWVTAPCRNGLDTNWEATNEAWRFTPNGAVINPTNITWYQGSPTPGNEVTANGDGSLTVSDGGTYFASVNYSTCSGTVNLVDEIVVTSNRKIWNGSTSTNWYKDTNWTPVGTPTATDCVVIPDVSTTSNRSPIVDIAVYGGTIPLPPTAMALARRVTVRNNGYLQVNAGTYLEIVDGLTVEPSGEVLIRSTGSLVQTTDVTTNNNIGNIRMQREVLGVGAQNYVYWSSPVENFSVANINSAASELRFKWEPTTTDIYGNWIATSEDMAVGRGYIVRGLATPPSPIPPNNAEFMGRPNNGIVNVPISRGNWLPAAGNYAGAGNTVATPIDDNWNLVGNPYPSAISANAFLVENASGTTPKIDGTIYLWSHVSLPSGNTNQDPFYGNYVYNYLGSDYVAYNIVGPNPPVFLGNIGAGQSFFVQMLDGAGLSNTVAFNNSMRSGSPANDNFMRTEERHRIWLDLVNSNEVASSTLVGYVTDATNERDLLYDGYDLSDTSMQFYSLIGEEEMTIQGRALPFDQEDRVPLGMVVPQNSSYKIAINTLDGVFSDASQHIYLEDTYLNTIYDLRLNPYEFTSESGTFNDRFILRYTNETLSTPDEVANFGFNIIGLKDYVKVTSSNSPIKTVKVYDVLGRLLADYKDVNALEFKFELINQSEGALIVKATLYNGQQKIKKVIY